MKNTCEDWSIILAQLQNGDPVAVIKITRVITGFLVKYQAYHIRDSWDDLCQEVLLALLKSIEQKSINEPKAIINYIGNITRNKLSDWITRQKKSGNTSLFDSSEDINNNTEALNQFEKSIDIDLLLDLQQALNTLDKREQSVVNAIYIQGHSYQAAAEILNIPLGSLKRIQVKALKTLRALILETTGPP